MSASTLRSSRGGRERAAARIEQRTVSLPEAAASEEVPVPPPRSASPGEGRRIDEQELLTGYLAAVTVRLEQRGVRVQETHSATLDSGELAGGMTLVRCEACAGRWAPTRLDWREDRGWSATLDPPPEHAEAAGHDHPVPRYLPQQVVPAPSAVAHFVAALNADEATYWASSVYRQPRRLDRRLLILRLSQFGLPEPW